MIGSSALLGQRANFDFSGKGSRSLGQRHQQDAVAQSGFHFFRIDVEWKMEHACERTHATFATVVLAFNGFVFFAFTFERQFISDDRNFDVVHLHAGQLSLSEQCVLIFPYVHGRKRGLRKQLSLDLWNLLKHATEESIHVVTKKSQRT